MPATTSNARAIKLARAAGSLNGIPFISPDRTPEQATAFVKFNEACVAGGFDPASTYADASQADVAVRRPQRTNPKPEAAAKPEAPKADKPKPEAAKPEKPTKPNASDKRTDYDKRVALIGELRVSVSALYNGPSLAVRTNPKRFASSVYADLLATPKHRTTLAKLSVRDESALFLIIKRGERNGSFDPAALNLDAGIFSRLASVGFIDADGAETFKLSADALAHARIVAKRAA
jgi:hypothetical protein